MKTYIIRPYFGYDCSSEAGFNNGNYLEEMEVEAEDEDSAVATAMARYLEEQSTRPANLEVDSHFGDGTLYWEHSHTWTAENGAEYSSEDEVPIDPDTEQPAECEVSYLYKYIDFNCIMVKS